MTRENNSEEFNQTLYLGIIFAISAFAIATCCYNQRRRLPQQFRNILDNFYERAAQIPQNLRRLPEGMRAPPMRQVGFQQRQPVQVQGEIDRNLENNYDVENPGEAPQPQNDAPNLLDNPHQGPQHQL